MIFAPTNIHRADVQVDELHQTLLSQVRSLRLALAQRLHLNLHDFSVAHPIMQWMVKLATRLVRIFLLHDAILHAYER